MLKLWIDDLRSPPDSTWHWAKTSEAALAVLGCAISHISFDHDLGGDDTAMPVAKRIEELAHEGKIRPIGWHVHSANPVGRQNLTAAMESAERYWSRNKKADVSPSGVLRSWWKRLGIRSGVPVALALLTSLIFFSSPAQAQDPDRSWVRKSVRSSCEWWENCRYRYRYYRVPRHYEIRNTYREREDRYSRDCKDFVTTVGEERYGRERAKEAAEQSWMEETRNRYGVRHMDLRNSRDGTWECGRSSTGNRASEKAQDMVGKYLEQCSLRARPCRAELERVNKD